jgi:hypothetical protein
MKIEAERACSAGRGTEHAHYKQSTSSDDSEMVRLTQKNEYSRETHEVQQNKTLSLVIGVTPAQHAEGICLRWIR